MDPTAPEELRLLTAAQVASMLGLSPRTVKHMASIGRLPRVVLGHRSTRYRLADVENLIESCTKSEAPAENQGSAKTRDADSRCPA